jgi:hypothetical protein
MTQGVTRQLRVSAVQRGVEQMKAAPTHPTEPAFADIKVSAYLYTNLSPKTAIRYLIHRRPLFPGLAGLQVHWKRQIISIRRKLQFHQPRLSVNSDTTSI